MKIKNFLKKLLTGAAIGVASAIPGVSGGTIAVLLKCYDKIINSISNLFKKFKESFLYLAPILLGVVLAIIPCIYLFNKAFEGFVFGIVSLFAGLIIGSFPSLTKEVKNEKVKPIYILVLIFAFLIALSLGILSAILGDKIDISSHFSSPEWWFFLVLIPVGALASVALIIPGISGSMLLLVLGFYTPLLEYANKWAKEVLNGNWSNILTAIGILGCFAVGIIIGFFTIAKIMSFLLKKHRTGTFFGIFGFIIGSTLTLYFNNEILNYYKIWSSGNYVFIPMWLEILIGVLLMTLGILSSYFLAKKSGNNKFEENEENKLWNGN